MAEKRRLEWGGEAYAPEPTNATEWAATKAQCELAADLYDECAERANGPRPLSVEHALYMIAVDWHNNMTRYGGLQRFKEALAKARDGSTGQIMT